MYKLAKYLIEQGVQKERTAMELDLLYYIGDQPVRYIDKEANMKENDDHFNRRLDAWFAARKLIIKFFEERSQQ